MIIFGLRVRYRITGSSAFFCPHCGGDREAGHGSARRWFTLFFIPVIPLNVVAEFVQCGTCQHRYDPSILERPTTSALSEVLGNAVRVLTAMMVRGGDVGNASMRAAAIAQTSVVNPSYDEATLLSDVGAVDPTSAELYLLPLADGLQVAGKERFLADLCRIALTSGTITPDQRWLLDATGRGLGLTPAHVAGIVSSVVSASTPGAPPAAGERSHPPAGEPPSGGTSSTL